MTDSRLEPAAELRQRALSRWDNEGGAIGNDPSSAILSDEPRMSNMELVHLRVRMIALENVVIALLAELPDSDHLRVREMADAILPRPGITQHPLTIEAATQMIHLVDRAAHFRQADRSA